MKRDERTFDTITEAQLKTLKTKTVVVVGSGGLGGYVIEMLARIGVGSICIIDGDVFDETNLNRQLYAREDNLGCVKVEEARRRVEKIRSDVKVTSVHQRITEENSKELLEVADIVMDCVDNVTARFVMVKACSDLKIPMVHGAVGGWNGQVMTIFPEETYLSLIYGEGVEAMPAIGAASFIPATIASYQVAEAIKYLTGTGELLRGRMMVFDLLHNENFVIDLGGEADDEVK